jgi:sn-glycerol 3-phosphate transport system substrate-binding protein
MHRSRRWLAVPTLAVALLAAACGGGSSGTSGGGDDGGELPPCPVGALDDATGTTNITIWYQISGKADQTLQKMVQQYNASQSKVKVSAELQGASYDELLRKYEQAIPSGSLPNILIAEDTATQFLVDSGTVLPAQSCFDADGMSTDGFVPAAVNHYTVDGALWPGSVSLSDILTYYNKNHLRRAGLDPDTAPATLDDVRRMAEQIKAAGVTETPVVMKMDSWFVETQLTGSGQTVVNNDNGYGGGETTEATFDTPETQAVFDWISKMQADGLLTAVPATDGNFDHYLAMAAQKASITIETSTAATSVEGFLGGDTSVAQGLGSGANVDTSGLDIGAAPVFGVDEAGKAQIGGNGFYITSTSSDAQKAAAWDFLTWWNQPEQQATWHMEGSYLPFVTSVADQPQVQEFWDTSLAGGWLKIAWQELTQGVDPNFTGPLIGPYDKFRLAMRNAMASVAFQGADPAAAISQATDETNKAITEYNDSNF